MLFLVHLIVSSTSYVVSSTAYVDADTPHVISGTIAVVSSTAYVVVDKPHAIIKMCFTSPICTVYMWFVRVLLNRFSLGCVISPRK